MLNNQTVKELFDWVTLSKADVLIRSAVYCESRDAFQAQLDNLFQQIRNPLLIAICGEIGNNSFDHNIGSWKDIPGLCFFSERKDNIIALADRGQGVRKTLSRILPEITSDEEAVKTAFTKIISGRSPEQRGNGLKFVVSVVINNNWSLYFQSGKGYAQIVDGGLSFGESWTDTKGCLAVVKYH